jgi:hypothetical protein
VKNEQQDISQFNIEKARLALSLYVVLGCCVCMIGYGWAMDYRAPLAVILVCILNEKKLSVTGLILGFSSR